MSWFESSRMGASSSCRTALLSTTLVRKACRGPGGVSDRSEDHPSLQLQGSWLDSRHAIAPCPTSCAFLRMSRSFARIMAQNSS